MARDCSQNRARAFEFLNLIAASGGTHLPLGKIIGAEPRLIALAHQDAVMILPSVRNLVLQSLVALLLPHGPTCALTVEKPAPAVTMQAVVSAPDMMLPALPPPTAGNATDEPFGGSLMIPIKGGELLGKWKTVSREIESEASILAGCASQQDCPAAARKFLDIVAEGREQNGLARVGVINRAVNLSIVPTSDMKQWGTADRWSSPLETLTTGRGDCEDYAIAKYAALLRAGIPRADVKLVIVHDRMLDQDHAIVAARVAGSWMVLDNRSLALVQDIELAHTTPLFVIDYSGVKAFAPQAPSTRIAAFDRENPRSGDSAPPQQQTGSARLPPARSS